MIVLQVTWKPITARFYSWFPSAVNQKANFRETAAHQHVKRSQMRERTIGVVCRASFLLLLVLTIGCDHLQKTMAELGLGESAAYKDGKAYLQAGAYEQAIEKLAQAQIEQPNNPEIPAALAQAKKLAAAQQFEMGTKLSTEGNIQGAMAAFEKAQAYDPGNAAYAERVAQEKRKGDEIRARVDQVVLNVQQTKRWKEGLTELESMRLYESSFPQLSTTIASFRTEAAAYHEGRSDQHLGAQDFAGASREMDQALEYSASPQIKTKREARRHVLLSEQALQNKKYLLAYEEILKGLEFERDNPTLKEYQKRLTEQWVAILYNEAVQAQNNGNLPVAKDRFTQISRLKPGYLNVEQTLGELRGTLSASNYSKAETFMRREDRTRLGNALANYLVVREQHDRQYPDLEDRIAEAKRLLKQEVELRISVTFRNQSEEPGADGLVTGLVVARMKSSTKLRTLNILDRSVIDDLLREQGLGQGFLDETTSLPVKKIKGVQAGLTGKVVKVHVRETGRDHPTYGSVKYPSGTRFVPNPDYARVQSEISMAQQDVMTGTSELGNAQIQAKQSQAAMNAMAQPRDQMQVGIAALGNLLQSAGDTAQVSAARQRLDQAQARLHQAQEELGRTPPQKEETVYDNFRYPIYDLKLEGEIILSYQLIDFSTSEVGEARTITKTDTKSDRYIQGDPGKGVKNDPNELPSRDDFLQQLMTQAIDETARSIEEQLAGHSYGYYQKALKADQGQFEEEAIEQYIRFLYSAPDLSEPRVQQANQYLHDKLGILIVRKKS